MRKIKLSFAFLFLLVVLSCKKDASVPEPEFNINNIAGKSWNITAYTVNGIDYYAELGNERLFVRSFGTNGKYQLVEPCNPLLDLSCDEDTLKIIFEGVWSIKSDKLTITNFKNGDEKVYTINVLTDKNFQYTYASPSGVVLLYTLSLKK